MTMPIIDFHSHYISPHWPLSADHHTTVTERKRWNSSWPAAKLYCRTSSPAISLPYRPGLHRFGPVF
jgi:hypothetical protein